MISLKAAVETKSVSCCLTMQVFFNSNRNRYYHVLFGQHLWKAKVIRLAITSSMDSVCGMNAVNENIMTDKLNTREQWFVIIIMSNET